MPSIRITQFAGLLPEVNAEALRNDHAQIAHNCLLWDGWLRPMPQWTQVDTFVSQPASLYTLYNTPNGFGVEPTLLNFIRKDSEPFTVSNVGSQFRTLYKGSPTPPGYSLLGVPVPLVTNIVQTITPQNLSVYPIPRTYAITFMATNSEGSPFIFPALGHAGEIFEGDVVTLMFSLNVAQMVQYGITGYRLYRTVPNFDTAEQLGNPSETGFHLVTEFNFSGNPFTNQIYADVFPADRIPGDLLLTDQFLPPANNNLSDFLGETESGWLVNCLKGLFLGTPSTIQLSERYLWDAWPPQNTISLPETITGMAVFYDDVFFGTAARPYHMRVMAGENEAVEMVVKPFPDEYACTEGTLVATNFGAMYASKDGMIFLEVNGDQVGSKKVANPGDLLGNQNIRFDSATKAIWWNGSYFGICSNAGYVFNFSSAPNNDFPLAQLVTIDVPPGIAGANIVTGSGLFSLWGNILYNFPLPGYGYESASKATYTWKSKRYVLPGLYTMAAAKVVNDSSGTLNFSLYGDGVLILSRPVTSSEPFRIPHQHRCIEWEIVVSGTSVVNEIHVATSMRELTETPGGE